MRVAGSLTPKPQPRIRGTYLVVRQKILLDVVAVRLEQDRHAAGVADEFLGALDHAVALAALAIADLAGRRDPEALLGAALGLHLGHFASSGLRAIMRRHGMPIGKGRETLPKSRA